MTDRDTFAAAALTGLLSAPTDKDRSSEYWARFSYEIADAMLRERGQNLCRKTDGSGTVTLTDAERQAVVAAQKLLDLDGYVQVAATLRGLLERLGGSDE